MGRDFGDGLIKISEGCYASKEWIEQNEKNEKNREQYRIHQLNAKREEDTYTLKFSLEFYICKFLITIMFLIAAYILYLYDILLQVSIFVIVSSICTFLIIMFITDIMVTFLIPIIKHDFRYSVMFRCGKGGCTCTEDEYTKKK